MAAKGLENGKMERLVKLDYSQTYRENDRLDAGLDEQLFCLKRSVKRMLSDKDDELELARADADKILKLKEAVNNRQNEDGAMGILCHSMRRKSSTSTSPSGKRKSSTANSIARRSSMGSALRSSTEDLNDEDNDEVDYSTTHSMELPNMKKMSLTERRLAMEREQYSAKNLFNSRRRYTVASSSYFTDTRKGESSPERQGSATPRSVTPQPQHQTQTRPRTSPAAYNRGRSAQQKQRGYLRPTTASASRLVSFAGAQGEEEEDAYRPARRPRSRRELQKLSELKIDPFGEEAAEVDSWAQNGSGDRQQDLLHQLRAGRTRLEARVAAFLNSMEEFNRKGRKTGLEQILEAT